MYRQSLQRTLLNAILFKVKEEQTGDLVTVKKENEE